MVYENVLNGVNLEVRWNVVKTTTVLSFTTEPVPVHRLLWSVS